jgi:ribosomal protein S13
MMSVSRYAKIRTIRSLRRVFEQFARGQYTGKSMKKAESA